MENKPVTRTIRFWFAPVLVVAVLMSLLSALYMGGILDPTENLHGFPVAIVNSDDGDTGPTGAPENFGDQLVDGLTAGIDKDKIDLRPMGISQATDDLDNGRIYGAIVVPSDFSKRLTILGQASVVAGDVDKPVITVLTNPRAGTLGSSILTVIGQRALSQANTTVGEQLTKTVTDTLKQSAPELSISGAAAIVLAEPIDIIITPHDPLPDGTGVGLSAFYYALLLLLAGFTGAMVVSSLVDSGLGFIPTEYGPFFSHPQALHISRFRTLLIKWALMAVVGIVVSALYVSIAGTLGMPTSHAFLLWAFGAFAITAVGVTAASVVAVFGTVGLLINLLVFVVLGLPSAGATVPLEATPRVFGWLANFEPMHQVYLGVRAILYYDARAGAGLAHGATAALIGLLIGLVLGGAVTYFYDRRGLTRSNPSSDTDTESVSAPT